MARSPATCHDHRDALASRLPLRWTRSLRFQAGQRRYAVKGAAVIVPHGTGTPLPPPRRLNASGGRLSRSGVSRGKRQFDGSGGGLLRGQSATASLPAIARSPALGTTLAPRLARKSRCPQTIRVGTARFCYDEVRGAACANVAPARNGCVFARDGRVEVALAHTLATGMRAAGKPKGNMPKENPMPGCSTIGSIASIPSSFAAG
jgi:hypothetical protein